MPDIHRIISTLVQACKRRTDTSATGRGGREIRGRRLTPFGLQTNPPAGSPTIAFCAHANPADAFFVVVGDGNPPPSVQEGETLIYGGGSTILLKANGNIEIRPAGDVQVIGGDLIVDGISFKRHTHPQAADSDGDSQADTGAPVI